MFMKISYCGKIIQGRFNCVTSGHYTVANIREFNLNILAVFYISEYNCTNVIRFCILVKQSHLFSIAESAPKLELQTNHTVAKIRIVNLRICGRDQIPQK